jgi:hypothetical protein
MILHFLHDTATSPFSFMHTVFQLAQNKCKQHNTKNVRCFTKNLMWQSMTMQGIVQTKTPQMEYFSFCAITCANHRDENRTLYILERTKLLMW